MTHSGHIIMKILAVTANYKTKNIGYLEQVIAEVKTWKHEVDIVISTDIPTGVQGVQEVLVTCPPREILSKTWDTILENKGKYDLYVYFENDHLITSNNLENWIKCRETVRLPYIVGFLEYETSPSGNWYQAQHVNYDFDEKSLVKIGDYSMCSHTNLHQGCFILDNELLDYVISHPHPNRWTGENHATFDGPNIEQHYGPLERVNTDIFRTPGLIRVIPISHLNNFLVHHLPNIHVGTWLSSSHEIIDKRIADLLLLLETGPKVSFVLPTMGARPDGLKRCLDSINNLKYPKNKIEIIVKYDDINNIIGVPKLVKQGVEESTGEWVVFIADDTELTPQSLLEALKIGKDGFVSFNTGELLPDGGNRCEHFMIRKDVIVKIGDIFDTDFHHVGCDNLLAAKMDKLGVFVRTEKAVVKHHHFSTGGKMDKTYEVAWSHVEEDRELLKKKLSEL